jgi:hypothetical protein
MCTEVDVPEIFVNIQNASKTSVDCCMAPARGRTTQPDVKLTAMGKHPLQQRV